MSLRPTDDIGGKLIPSAAARWWMRLAARGVARGYYRTRRFGDAGEGPTLFVGLHRNGAVDGWVHADALRPDIVFFVGNNLRRNPLTRLFAVGIGLERAKDGGDTSANRAALAASLAWLAQGHALFIYPEGTSTLGPHPLPFQTGAARLAVDAIAAGIPLRVVPVGIDYAAPATPGSEADVIVGRPIALDALPQSSHDAVGELHRTITRALTDLASVFPDEATQKAARRAAIAGSNGDGALRLRLLRSYADGTAPIPGDTDARYRARHGGTWPAIGAALAVLPGAIINAPLVAAAWAGARKFADGPNVVALYRLLIGIIGGALWLLACAIAAVAAWGIAGLALPFAQIALGLLALRHGEKATALFTALDPRVRFVS